MKNELYQVKFHLATFHWGIKIKDFTKIKLNRPIKKAKEKILYFTITSTFEKSKKIQHRQPNKQSIKTILQFIVIYVDDRGLQASSF